MPQDRAIPGTPQDWLDRAKSDLAFARLPLPEGAYYEDLCFHAQQAAEKARRRTAQEIYGSLRGLGFAKDVVVVTESDIGEYGDNPSLVLYPALREGRELYHAAG